MKYQLFTATAAITMCLIGAAYAQAPTGGSYMAPPSSTNAPSVAASRAQAQGPLDEQIEVELIHPIPMMRAPAGCMVTMTERYCRADKEPIKSFLVLHQRTVGRSSIQKIVIDNGCVVAQVKIGVDEDNTGTAQCVGGEPLVRMRLLLSARPAPKLGPSQR